MTAGSRGDVQPIVALARGAQSFGFDVKVAANAEYECLVRQSGLPYVPFGTQSPKQVWTDEAQTSHAARGALRYARIVKRILQRKPPHRERLREISHACKGSSAVVFSHATFSVYHVAEHLGVKAIAAYLYPSLPSSGYPAMLTPPGIIRSAYYNALTHFIVNQTFWTVDRPWVNRWRTEDLSLSTLGLFPPLSYFVRNNVLNLHGFSPSVVPPPGDWPLASSATGYWFLDEGVGWQPSLALARFVESGPPPVCVTFGSEIDANPAELYTAVFDALTRVGVRAILVTGWADQEKLPRSERVFVVDSVPYDWIFPRMSCVVHHAGTGTAAEVLRAGKPSVCVPFHGEQRFWAHVMHSIGASYKPIPRSKLTAEALATALRIVMSDDYMRSKATVIGSKIRSESGVERAVHAMDAFLAGRSSAR